MFSKLFIKDTNSSLFYSALYTYKWSNMFRFTLDQESGMVGFHDSGDFHHGVFLPHCTGKRKRYSGANVYTKLKGFMWMTLANKNENSPFIVKLTNILFHLFVDCVGWTCVAAFLQILWGIVVLKHSFEDLGIVLIIKNRGLIKSKITI